MKKLMFITHHTVILNFLYLLEITVISIFYLNKLQKQFKIYFFDIAEFDMSYEEFKDSCREAWKENCSYLKNIRLDDKEKNYL